MQENIEMKKIPMVVVLGPTASGKTALSIQIAKALGGEIVSADSMQVYKLMDIGTAKPTSEERQGIKHHLIDEVMPDEEFNVCIYADRAKQAIADISARGKLPVLTGGTGLYINSVCENVDFCETQNDYALRDELTQKAMQEGSEGLHTYLSTFDPEAAGRIHANDVKRIVRAIEVYTVSGTTITEHQRLSKLRPSPYETIKLMITWDREALYRRIDRRVDLMLEQGLVDEVNSLLKMGYTTDMVSMHGLGYKEILWYLQGECSLQEAVDILKRDSRRYAKRQLTWFRPDKKIIELSCDDSDIIEKALGHINHLYTSEIIT